MFTNPNLNHHGNSSNLHLPHWFSDSKMIGLCQSLRGGISHPAPEIQCYNLGVAPSQWQIKVSVGILKMVHNPGGDWHPVRGGRSHGKKLPTSLPQNAVAENGEKAGFLAG